MTFYGSGWKHLSSFKYKLYAYLKPLLPLCTRRTSSPFEDVNYDTKAVALPSCWDYRVGSWQRPMQNVQSPPISYWCFQLCVPSWIKMVPPLSYENEIHQALHLYSQHCHYLPRRLSSEFHKIAPWKVIPRIHWWLPIPYLPFKRVKYEDLYVSIFLLVSWSLVPWGLMGLKGLSMWFFILKFSFILMWACRDRPFHRNT